MALLSVIRETGARINEILNLNINDVRFEKDKAFVKLLNSKRKGGKQSHRELVLIDSFYHLENWLRTHPLKKDSDSPLFVNRFKRRFTKTNVNMFLTRLKKETNFKKPIHPHHFRHSEANDTAKFLTDAEMRVRYGWEKGSLMVARYTHLNSDDVNNKMLQQIGREETPKIIKKEELKSCPRCNEKVDFNLKFCGKCGMALDEKYEIKQNVHKEIQFEELKKDIEKETKDLKNEISEIRNEYETEREEKKKNLYDEVKKEMEKKIQKGTEQLFKELVKLNPKIILPN